VFWCGDDKLSGQNFDLRRQSLVDKTHQLSSIFAIAICAYAIISNHNHLVLKSISDTELVIRCKHLFNRHVLVDSWLTQADITQAEQDKAREFIQMWQTRLYDWGGYMPCLNEGRKSRAQHT